jgi:zinc protease
MSRRLLPATFLVALLLTWAVAAAPSRAVDLAAPLPLDAAVTTGTLPNGLRYYVRPNAKPEQRAALWLVVGAGAVEEDDDQNGLAHLVEHMAFNGTENFPRQELVGYLESIGMQFGPEVNAYTNQNETVYMLQVPTDKPELLDTGLRILEEWAHRISFEDEEIDKERGVVIEEWRLGRGADERMSDAQMPILYKGSRYAERNVIGDPEILRHATYETLKRFYRDWYRPDLMAVVAVGDFDAAAVEGRIRELFGAIPARASARPRLQPEVPDHAETLFAIATDPEATGSGISLIVKHALWPEGTVGDYRDGLRGLLANAMLRTRLAEIARQADPPFSSAFAMDRPMARTKAMFMLRASVKEDGIARGFEAVLTELERARRHGFTEGELERVKAEALRQAEQAAAEAQKTESQRHARTLQMHFLRGSPYIDAASRLQLARDLLPGITVDEVESRLRELTDRGSRVVTVEAPRKDGLAVPTEGELAAVMAAVQADDIPAYVDAVVDEPLVPRVPAPAAITARETDPDLGTTTWTLANGVRVVLKPTDFKNDEILLWATSPGGSSTITDDAFHARATGAAGVVGNSGVGAFDPTALQKKLAGRLVRVTPYVSSYEEGLRGGGSPQDLETLLQLTWLLVTAPRQDETVFRSLVERQRMFLQNRAADPETAFRDSVTVVLTGHHPRRQPPSLENLSKLDLADGYAFYRDRFGDCSDFTVFLVGSVDPAAAEPLVRTWLGNLPAGGRKETWRDEGVVPPRGVQERVLHRGSEPKGMVEMVFMAKREWSWPAEVAMDALVDVLRIRLRETIREDMSGTYGVRVSGGLSSIPYGYHQLTVGWGCDPGRVDELTAAVWEQLRDIAANGPDDKTLAKVAETWRRDDETNLKRNDFWLGELARHQRQGTDPRLILQGGALADGLSADVVKEAARAVIDPENVVKVVLLPQEG